MLVSTAILCDFAQVREDLLFVVSGGITRMFRPQVPADVRGSLAMVVDLDPVECGSSHGIKVVIIDQDGGELAKVEGEFRVNRDPNIFQIGEVVQAKNVLGFELKVERFGSYDVVIYIDGQYQRTLTFYVTPPPLAQAS